MFYSKTFFLYPAIVVAIVFSFSTSFSLAQSQNENELNVAAFEQARTISVAFRTAAQKALPATVKILVKKGAASAKTGTKLPFSELMPNLPDVELIEGGGSGFIVDPSGVIVSNSHVVQGFDEGKIITVELNDRRRFDAKKIIRDAKADVAVITIETPEPLPYLTFADSNEVKIGDWALAIGNPFMLGASVSAGVVSAKERFVEKDSKIFIQTDAAVNPGNSGGPLVNLRGEVIGVNTAIASLTGGYQGVGFAIPSNTAQWAWRQLYENGRVERAFLGASMTALTYEESQKLSLPSMMGVKLHSVFKDTPAANAGLHTNDVITEIDGRPIESPELFESIVERADTTRKYSLTVLRNNTDKPTQVPIQFFIKPQDFVNVPQTEKIVNNGAHHRDASWGLMLIPSTPESAARIGADGKEGLLVLNATPGGVASRNGVRSGALITKINGVEVKTIEEYEKAKSEADPETGVVVEFFTKGAVKTATLPVKK